MISYIVLAQSATVFRLIDPYGPYVFGLIVVLVIWKVVVAPELVASRLALKELSGAARTMQQTADILSVVAETVKETAMQQKATVEKMAISLDKIEELRRCKESRNLVSQFKKESNNENRSAKSGSI